MSSIVVGVSLYILSLQYNTVRYLMYPIKNNLKVSGLANEVATGSVRHNQSIDLQIIFVILPVPYMNNEQATVMLIPKY